MGYSDSGKYHHVLFTVLQSPSHRLRYIHSTNCIISRDRSYQQIDTCLSRHDLLIPEIGERHEFIHGFKTLINFFDEERNFKNGRTWGGCSDPR